MPTYNKPGVYVEETPSATASVASGGPQSVAAFIGIADRGPTKTTDAGTIVPAPTLVTSWADFVNTFSFGNVINTFSSTVEPNSDALKFAVKTFFDNGGSQAYIGRLVNTDAANASVTFNTTLTGTSPALTVTAKDPGLWGNNLWATVVNNVRAGYFDLYIYYSETAGTSTNITYKNHLEHYLELSMDPTNPRYILDVVTSPYIVLSKPTANTTNTIPAATSTNGTSQGAGKKRLSGGTKGVNNPNTYDDVLTTLDPITGPMVLNWPDLATDVATTFTVTNKVLSTNVATLTVSTGSTGISVGDTITVKTVGAPFTTATPAVVTAVTASTSTTDISYSVTASNVSSTTATGTLTAFKYTTNQLTVADAQLQYAYDRGDGFVVLDAGDDTVANVTSVVYGTANSLSLGYGAVYYPHIYVSDPTSRVGASVKVAPGGAVTAMYMNADSERGAFQSPAGTGTRIRGAVSVASLSNSDFTTISNSTTPINVIRYVPGAGICVMGARTLSTELEDRYVAVRRSLQFINASLVAQTLYAVFEPNDSVLWNRVSSTVNGFLYNYWRKGGLKGTTPSEAYYVKCDGSINDQTAIDAGELRIEVGVALQKPAEFVIIKIGQIDGGATVVTSV